MPPKKRLSAPDGLVPTIPDIVVLSMIMEKPAHGYELIRELNIREVHDWAQISRPQVYYSITKLLRAGWLMPVKNERSLVGPEREVCCITEKGKAVLVQALGREDWATEREVPKFITWLALRHWAPESTVKAIIDARRRYLQRELAKEKETLQLINSTETPVMNAAGFMVEFCIRRFLLELDWLDELEVGLLSKPQTL